MAFRKKADLILAYEPDILIIPECEHPDKLKFTKDTPAPTDIFWYGSNPHKGLGVFSYSKYRFRLHEMHNPDLRYILPITVTGGRFDFILFAIWANNPEDKDGQYITQVWKAIHYYDKLIVSSKTIMIGDFNSNAIWDRPKRLDNHTSVVDQLAQKNIFSTYHVFNQQTQGKEDHPTLYLYRHQNRPYHVDYCFASADFIDRLSNVEVGHYDDWKHCSDHKPLIVTFDF